MKGNIYSRLWIPKPCHEDWNQMTPDEKGAFCKSCNKSVYDFTTKNEEQVEAILTAAKGKEVCGRFDTTQLAALPELEIPIHVLPRNLSPYRKFVLAVFIVFGTALFGCVNSYGQKMGKVRLTTAEPVTEERTFKGEVAVRGTVVIEAEEKVSELTPVKDEPVITMGDTIVFTETVIESNLHMLGGVSVIDYRDEMPVVNNDVAVTEKEEVIPVRCEFLIDEPEVITGEGTRIITGGLPGTYGDLLEKENTNQITIIKESIICQKDSREEAEELTGANDVEPVLPFDQSDNEKNDNTATTFGDGLKPSIECYPNPSTGPVNIRYEIKKRCDVRMELFDRSGKKVRTLIDHKGYYNGIYTTAFDLSDLDAGTYICVLQAGEEVSSAKVVITK